MNRFLKRLGQSAAAAALIGLAAPTLADTVKLWSFLDPNGEGARSTALKYVLDTFEEANNGAKVETNVIQWREIAPSLLRAAQSQQTPDLVMLYSPFLPSQIAAGSLMPLNACLKEEPAADLDDLIVLSSAKDDAGNIYGVPWDLRVLGLFYRSDLLREAGLQPPQSFGELISTAKHFSDQGMIGLGMSFSPGRSAEPISWFLPMAVGMGAKVLNADGTAAFNSPPVQDLLNRLHDAVYKDKVLPLDLVLSASDDVQQMAESGRVVFFDEGSHRVVSVREKSGDDVEWSFMAPPGIEPGTTSPANLEGWHLVIPKAAKNPGEACALIKHWVSPDMQRYQTLNAGYMPVRRSLADDAALQTPENAHVATAVQYAASNPLKFKWPESTDALNEALGQMIERVLADQMTPEEAAAASEKSYNAQLH